VWIAVPQELSVQKVTGLQVRTDHPWSFVEDPDFHNRVVEVTVDHPTASLTVDLSARVRRFAVQAPIPARLDDAKRKLYLRQESLVSLSPRIRALADSVGGDSRARYDYVLGLMSYDKTAPGWGKGDSERACDVHKGNCTDFHSLFMSLSRARNVPVYFEMGYSTLPEGEIDKVGGYHCWAWFYDDAAAGWTPVDISEADQHPEKAGFFYGHLDADRIAFSRGRDIRLPGMKGAPLNYLGPTAYVEVDGKPLESVSRSLTYRLAEDSEARNRER
jgi:transglutaminase-like putative cysteine protease